MDSGNSGSISSSGDEEYDSRADHTVLSSPFLNNNPTQFGSISHPQSSLVSSHHHHPSLFDLSSSYLHTLSHSQPNSNPNSFLNLDTGTTSQGRRSEPDCTDPAGVVSPSSTPTASGINQYLFSPQGLHQGATDPSLQLRSVHDDNARVLSSPTNAARNSKKRTRASRRAPTTVLTTDTSNFRAMVQEFTGIPAPPFSGSSYSRRLDLLTASSSLRSSSSHLETTGSFYPLRPSPQKLHHPNPFLLSSSSPSPSTLLHGNMVDAIASTTNITSSATTNNSSSSNSINYQLPPDLGLPYHHQQSIMLGMQNHQPILTFNPTQPLYPFGNHLPAGFSTSKSQASLSVPSLEDLDMSHGQVNAHLVAGGVSVPTGHGHVTSEGMSQKSASASDDGSIVGGPNGGGRRDPCKLNFSTSASSNLNHEKSTLENNSTRGGEGNVDSWICSSD
ncbi:uncharacterized protein LOC133295302 [Gastrolobium bilobum]|uniref:uncharacterized protein LOC133295302 n=1 Tax=Gastrolobium bilobum TaxID=150636 RepID=UPI002AB0E1AD|nr:uncharacterized protein LOC133295302 [Gastrolobium bilobum]